MLRCELQNVLLRVKETFQNVQQIPETLETFLTVKQELDDLNVMLKRKCRISDKRDSFDRLTNPINILTSNRDSIYGGNDHG